MRWLIDECVDAGLASLLRESGHDVVYLKSDFESRARGVDGFEWIFDALVDMASDALDQPRRAGVQPLVGGAARQCESRSANESRRAAPAARLLWTFALWTFAITPSAIFRHFSKPSITQPNPSSSV